VKTASSLRGVSPFKRLRYAAGLWRRYQVRNTELDRIFDWSSDFKSSWEQHGLGALSDKTAVEIGFGQRPARLMIASIICRRAVGIDLDRPMLQFSLAAAFDNARRNGAWRAVKTAVRSLAFDPAFYSNFDQALMSRFGRTVQRRDLELRVSDVSRPEAWEGLERPSIVYSYDVFEHMPADLLDNLLSMVSQKMDPVGICHFKVNIFTGITGGHDPGWYTYDVQSGATAKTPAWRHLNDPDFVADTYLNRLSLQDYDSLFAEYFDVLDKVELTPQLGFDLLDEKVKHELYQLGYSDQDLFSNNVRWILRPKKVLA
jgi:hypothetical protein